MKRNKLVLSRAYLWRSKPWQHAMIIPAAYISLATLYILFSSKVAAIIARDVNQLQLIEQYKGLGYVFTTGLLLYLLCYFLFKRIHIQTKLLVQTESQAVAGMAGACMAHDLNNLLMMLSGVLELTKTDQPNDEIRKTIIRDLDCSIEQLTRFSKNLMHMTNERDKDKKQQIDMVTHIRFILKLLSKHPSVRKCKLHTSHLDSAHMFLNAQLFEQAILNLVLNAAQAAKPTGGEIRLALKRVEKGVLLQVDDNGQGVSLDLQTEMFTPGYTTKPDGSGLGLLCVQAFAESCGAKITVTESDLGGASFRLCIPDLKTTECANHEVTLQKAPTAQS